MRPAATLLQIPLSGAATKGGKLLFCATWSIDAGDGIDDKLVFCTDLGELIDLHRQQSSRPPPTGGRKAATT